MNEQNKKSCCSKQTNQENIHPHDDLEVTDTDLVCGMPVEQNSPHFIHLNQQKYLFCSNGCKEKFVSNPSLYLKESDLQKVSLRAEENESTEVNTPLATQDEQPQPNANQTVQSCCGSKKSDINITKTDTQGSTSCCDTQQSKNHSDLHQINEALNQSNEFSEIDPVCGMTVRDPNKPHITYQDKTYYFCNPKCLDKFQNNPQEYLNKENKSTACCGNEDQSVHKVQHQSAHKSTGCCGSSSVVDGKSAIDPVCGMTVSTTTELKTDYQNQTYYFCNPSCLEKFKHQPEPYLIPMDQRTVPEGMDDVLFTCPMDPEIVQKGPGTCPICGMALEPMQPSLDDGPNPELVDFSHRFWVTLPLTLLVFILAMGSHIHAFIPQHIQPWIELILSTPVVLWAAKPFIERCFSSYKTRNLNMWSLIGVGILAAYIYSVVATIFPSLIPVEAKTGHGVAVYFEAACMIVSLSLLGQIMELKARAKTADSLKALLRLQPTKARRVLNGQIQDIEIDQIQKNDILQIASGEHIPLDGIVIDGSTHIDESMMTGEPLPVKKAKGDHVIGGTVNQQGSIQIRTTAVGQNTTLAKMIQTVADAQRSKAPLQKMADVVAKYFVVIVLAISILTFIAWMIFGNAQFDLALMCAVAVLIIACPCALGLATPMSVMATTGRAAQKGVLFKDAEAIEALSKVNVLIIDKTGTLTEGKPSLKEIKLISDQVSQTQVETWIASIEQHSTHPIAKTLSQLVPSDQVIAVTEFEDVSGFGVKAKINDQWLHVGSQKMVEQLGLSIPTKLCNELNQQRVNGQVISFLANDVEVLAYISIHDAIKSNAKTVLDQLQSEGVEVVMASGDHEKNAQLVAQALGIQHVYGNCTPQDKLDIVKKYQSENKVVAMAGDGINDAPALAQANIGIAMGNGTDIAKQTAQVTLVKGDVRGLSDAIQMAKLGVRNMKQNLAFSFVYNGLGVPVAAGIFYPLTGLLLTPMLAAVAMSLSSLSVVVNALRLNKS